MERFLNIHFVISILLIIIALVITVGAYTVYAVKANVRTELVANINRQATIIGTLAELTDHNGADEGVEKIVVDCPRRAEFENLLVQLGTLSRQKLLDTQQLFESCGGFYVERKALMVSRLEREYEILQDNVLLLQTLDSHTKNNYHVDEWGQLISWEHQRSDLLNEQLNIQRDIIALLIEGKMVTSLEMQTLISRANDIEKILTSLGTGIDTLRSQLTS